MIKLFLTFFILLSINAVSAPTYLSTELVRSEAPVTVIVTHASQGYDKTFAAKSGIDRLVRRAKQARANIFYISNALDRSVIQGFSERGAAVQAELANIHLDRNKPNVLYMSDMNPTAFVTDFRTSGGVHNLTVSSQKIVFGGGYFEGCMTHSAALATLDAHLRGKKNLELNYATDAIYTSCPDDLGQGMKRWGTKNMTLKECLDDKGVHRSRVFLQSFLSNWFHETLTDQKSPMLYPRFFNVNPYMFQLVIKKDGRVLASQGYGHWLGGMTVTINLIDSSFSL